MTATPSQKDQYDQSSSSHVGGADLALQLQPVNKAQSIYIKLAMVFSLLVVLIGSAVLFLGYQSIRDYYQEITQELNKDVAMYMASSYQLDAQNLDKSRVELGLISSRSMILNPSIEIYLLDSDGHVLDHNQRAESIVRQQVELQPINQFLVAETRFPLRGSDPKSIEKKKIFSVFPLQKEQQIEGYVYVILGGQLFDDIASNIRSSYVLQTSFALALLVVLAALILGLIAFKSITSRLAVLTQSMLEFSCERPTKVLFPSDILSRTVTGNDEIALLQQSFTKLTAKIEEQFNQLKYADQHRRELVSNVSHDLRTPLAITKGYIETLCIKNDQLSTQERLKYLQTAQRSNEHLASLIDDLFELSKLEADQMALKCEPFSLLELIYDTVQEFEILAAQKNIEIRVPSPTHNVMVHADIALIQRVFANLIANAIKFTPDQGRVSIDFSIENSGIKVSVKDTGCGIAPEDIPHIFERYYFKSKRQRQQQSFGGDREQRYTTATAPMGINNAEAATCFKSTGLGLAIVKKILELHNCSIQVSSLAKQGAIFQFLLPVAVNY